MSSTGSTGDGDRVSATGGSARSQADDLDERRWRPRRGLALVVRLVSIAVPVVAAATVVHIAGLFVSRPHGAFALAAWLVALAVLATVTVRIVDHAGRRLLPLSALLRLSLVFPDHTPSRFSVALRSGNGRALQRAVTNATSVEGFPAPQESAELLVALVSQLGRHDRLTRGHSERVRAYADLIGQQLELDDDARVKLHWAALIHDVGKLDVPAEILTKKGRPTDEEWTVLREHPGAGAKYLGGLEAWLGDWARAASEHHERVDGSGYPRGLRGDEISLAGRIVSVADAYDVMTSARSYKKPHPAARARAELAENAGTQFDPDVVRAFLSVSLRDVSLVMGPLAILTQLPTLAQIPFEAASAALGPAIAGVAATALAFAAPAHGHAPSTRAPDAVAVSVATPGSRAAGSTPAGRAGHAGAGPGVVTVTTTVNGRVGSTTTTPGAPPTQPRRGGGTTSTTSTTSTTRPTGPPPSSTTTTVPSANHPPNAVNDTPSGKFHTQTVTIAVLANDSDPDGNLAPSTLSIVKYPPAGKFQSITIVGGTVRFTAPAGYKGSANFRYQICDTDGACAQAEVNLGFAL